MQALKDILTPEELARVTRPNNWRAAGMVLFDWTCIISVFYLMAVWPNPLTILAGIIVLGSRQLGLGVIVHETGHRSLFSSPAVNDFVGRWLSGYWIFSDKTSYMKTHLQHHQKAGTADDPDLGNYAAFPIPRVSLQRKFTRDLTGQIGWRRIKSIGRALRRLADLPAESRHYLLASLGLNLSMLIALAAAGHAWLYATWVIAFMTSHMLVVRIRQIAEHAAVPDHLSKDPRDNTRTLYTNWLERFFIAPHGVNYHLEHHLMASVPIYRLPALHRLLLARGYFENTVFQQGYIELLKTVTYPTSQATAA